jgi:chromosomal replication initiator protein
LAVCGVYGFSLIELLSHRRTARLVRARQVAVYLCCALTPHSLPAIGRRFGGKNHTTILHSQRRIAALILTDQELAATVAKLRIELGAAL